MFTTFVLTLPLFVFLFLFTWLWSFPWLFVTALCLIMFVKSVHTTQFGIRSLSYTGSKLWSSLSIEVYVRKSSRFSVFVNISRILWVMVIMLLLIANVLRLHCLDYHVISEVIMFLLSSTSIWKIHGKSSREK